MTAFLDYQQALNLILSLADFERRRDRTHVPRRDLSRSLKLLERLGNPHDTIPAVHIAGTKGKGSTATMIASVLKTAGYRVGLFTSPHLHSFRERIQVNGIPVSEEQFAHLIHMVWPHRMVEDEEGDSVAPMRSVFELLTGMAFLHFQMQQCDIVVLEVGIGGRLDTTNVCHPVVSVITSISLDHTNILGNTIDRIAYEKSGIIKHGVPVVVAPQTIEASKVIREHAAQCAAPVVEVKNEYSWSRGDFSPEGQHVTVKTNLTSYTLWIKLLGTHQLENAATAVATLEVLRERGFQLNNVIIEEGLRQAELPGRMEVLKQQPLIVADGAHNPYSIRCLLDTLPEYFNYKSLQLVIGCGNGHNSTEMVAEISKANARIIVTRSRHPGSLSPSALAEKFARNKVIAQEVDSVDLAMEEASKNSGQYDLVVATGSLFVAGEAREKVKKITPELYPSLRPRITSV